MALFVARRRRADNDAIAEQLVVPHAFDGREILEAGTFREMPA